MYARQFLILSSLVLMALPALAKGPSKSTTEAPLTLSVILSHPAPVTGSKLHYRVIVQNAGRHTVSVPRNLFDHLTLSGEYIPPSRQADVPSPAKTAVGAATPITQWTRLRPGQSLEVFGELADVFKECQGGCQSGTYHLWGELNHPPVDALSPGRLVPRYQRVHLAFEAKPNRLPRIGNGVRFRVLNAEVKSQGRVELHGEIDNRSATPIWLPKSQGLLASCGFRIVTPSQTVVTRQPLKISQHPSYTEHQAVFLRPGQKTLMKLNCAGVRIPGLARAQRVYVRASLRPLSSFYPLKPVPSPFYLAAPLRAAEKRILIKQ
jgi:hypothetical protein